MKRFSIIIISIILFASCGRKSEKVPNIDLKIDIQRFDKDVFAIRLDSITTDVNELRQKYDEIFDMYSYRIVGLGNPQSPDYDRYMNGFLTDYGVNYLKDESFRVFENVSEIEIELTNAFKRYVYYFPNKTVPQVFTFIGGLNQSMVSSENLLGIGIDKYLGTEWEGYDKFGIDKYKRTNMHPKKIPSDAVRAWALTEFPFNDSVNTVISNVVYHGMVQYFIDKMLPNENDTLKYGFTQSQLHWCENNEQQMWAYMIENKLLFDTDFMTIKKLVEEAPFSSFFTRESPGRAVIYIGYNIVDKYMNKHPEVSLKQLMEITDYHSILNESGYKP